MNPNNVTKCEKLFNSVIPKKYSPEFQRGRIEKAIIRNPEKRGYLYKLMKLEEHKESQEIEENKRMETNE
uniref:Uncharacterized protein n=1 Tax=Methanococcus maripaludis (strain C7 / ATCC BAA-1331) TaxID=426368 RepID=A6VHN8_METM7